jgi:hypothetical protein
MKTSFLFLAVLILGGCNQTTYQTYGEKSAEISGERVVQYTVSKAFYRMAPDCVVVLPAIGQAKAKDKILIEHAAARHLRGKLERVIGPDERRSLAHRLALDFSNAADRRYFANYRHKSRSCRYFAKPSILGIDENFALIWAGRRVHLGLEIVSGRTDDSLWKGDHSTDRGDGGLPFSPLSLGSAAFRAGKLNADKDMLPSMIDDVFRRILKTLPDMRHF